MYEPIARFLFYRMDTVEPAFGAFHIISILLILAACVFAGFGGSRLSDKNLRKLLLGIWVVLILGEVYRELAFATVFTDYGYEMIYQWYQFPFQLCSSPLYALPFVIFLPDGKLRDGFMAFLTTFCFFGGAVVTFYPNTVLTRIVGSNIQSMLHHGIQAIVGILLVSFCRKKLGFRFYVKGAYVFAGFLSTAMVMNIIAYHIIQANGTNDVFNMFYISPYFGCEIPILSSIQQAGAPYPVVLLLYVLTFVLIAAIIALAEYFISMVVQKKNKATA